MKDKTLKVTKNDLEKQLFDLKQLLEISKSLNSTLDYGILIDSILYICMGQLKVLKAGILTRKSIDNPDLILYRNYVGFEVIHGKEYCVPDSHPFLEIMTKEIRCYKPEEVINLVQDEESIQNIIDLQPSLMVPLKAKGIIHGLLILGDRIGEDDFTDYEMDYLENIALFAAIAIHNAFLFEMTTTDMMTKLKMKHYFLSALIEKQEEAIRDGEHLSIIMIDIDHFKLLNDTYGHLNGDSVLINVADTVQQSIRQIDTAARYGGEEFVVLLPGANLTTARGVAERIRQQVELMITPTETDNLKVTISLGVAEFCKRKDKTTKHFIDRADKALYYSKQHGRNQVTLAT